MSITSRRASVVLVSSLCAALLLGGVARAQGSVIVVDDDGGAGVDFTSLPAAVAAAANGDVVLVRAGDYPGALVIDGKSLVITAEAGAAVELQQPTIDVRNLAANQSVVFRGIDGFVPQWNLADNLGTVWIEDSAMAYGLWNTQATVIAQDCNNVVLQDCTIVAMGIATVFVPDTAASDAIAAGSTQLTLNGCALQGGDGNGQPYGADVVGGDALEMSGGSLFVTDSTLQGGNGQSKTGGTGLRLDGGTAAWLLDATLQGGPGFTSGPPSVVTGNAPNTLAGPAPSMTVASPLRYGEAVQLSVTGEPGSLVYLLKYLTPVGVFAPQYGGTLLLDPGLSHTLLIGAVPGTGQLDLNAIVPALPAFESVGLFMQVALAPPSGGVSLSNGTHVVLLNPASVPPAP